MNDKVRVKIKGVVKVLDGLQEQLDGCMKVLDMLSDEEQEKYDNMPEALQYSESGETIKDCAFALHDSAVFLGKVVADLDRSKTGLKDF